MKSIIVIIILSSILLLAQTSKEEKLEWIRSRGDIKVTAEENDIYRFEYPGGRTQHFYLGKTEMDQTDTIPTTIIETWNVDTTLYQDMYSFWQEVLVSASATYELTIGDMNKNGFPEIYGYSRDYGEPSMQPMEIFEMDSTGIFISKYKFPDSVITSKGIFDLSGNNDFRLHSRGRYTGYALFYKIDDQTLLGNQIDFVYTLNPGQIDNPKIGDFDKNGITDFLFYEYSHRRIVICEYDSSLNNFAPVTQIPHTLGFYKGFSVGDFDLDDKTDIVYGSLEGEVFVIEAESEHSYSHIWEKDIVGMHSFMHISTNDINNNGRPEFWVSTTTHIGGTDITRFTSFEYIYDNIYKETHRIDFEGIFPLYAENAFSCDVNADGKEELVICISGYVFIMKFKGSAEKSSYEIYYMMKDNLPGSFFGVTMFDLDDDGYEELLIHRDIVRNDGHGKHVTHIYKPELIVSIDDGINDVISGYSLEQNYPNPFNPVTTISYRLPKRSFLSLKVYDILGNEVAILDEGERSGGEHTIEWNGIDKFHNQVNSGIYFIHLATSEYTKTIKGVLLK
jgi:hypothetical protein